MNKFFRNLIVQFREFYKNMGPTKKVAAIIASLVLMLALLITGMMVTGADYAPLFTNIPPTQLSTIVDQLQKRNIDFKVSEDSTAVLVPKEMLPSTQMAIMAEIGSDKLGSMGLELFEKQDFATTSYVQRVNYQRGLQGELIRAINTLDSVKRSKVILALPPQKTFLEEGGKPTASVVVEMYPGKRLNQDQVRGITYLVASAVENMEADDVTVVDSRGKVLTKHYDGSTAASTQLMEIQQKVEHQLEERIESILAKVVGHGKVIAKVNASLNPQQVTTLEELFDPDKTAVRSQLTEEEKLDGNRTNPVGVPGARANLPGAQDAGNVAFQQNVNKEIKTLNYEVPKTVRNIKQAAGAIDRLSVAVLVDGVYQNIEGEDGAVSQQWTQRTPEELAKYETIVRNAIGFNDKRGDSVSIENIQFKKEGFDEAKEQLTELERKRLITVLVKWSLLGFSLLLFFFVIIRPFIRWITESVHDSVEDMLPKTIEELEELQSVDSTLPGMSSALPVLEEALDPNKAESELLKERIMNLMEQDEEKAASAFSLWLVRRDY